jgi:prepilin-type N-terminal cleavage/methylation domain-containing protein
MKKGFTLIEVLISLVILSIIAIVSTNFLQSSIDLRNQSKSKVDDIKVFNYKKRSYVSSEFTHAR